MFAVSVFLEMDVADVEELVELVVGTAEVDEAADAEKDTEEEVLSRSFSLEDKAVHDALDELEVIISGSD